MSGTMMTHVYLRMLWDAVKIIRSNPGDPSKMVTAMDKLQREFASMPQHLALAVLSEILQNSPAWSIICLSNLQLATLCSKMEFDSQINNRLIAIVRNAYEPAAYAVDNGMTDASKRIVLSVLGDRASFDYLRKNAAYNKQEVGEYLQHLGVQIIQTIGSRPDETD